MFLSQWILKHKKSDRKKVREALGVICGCSEITIRSYINGNRSIPSRLFIDIEKFTKKYKFGKVTCEDLATESSLVANKRQLKEAA